MNMSVIARGSSQKVNRRTKLVVDLTEVNDQLEALSNVITVQDGEITSLSNAILDNETSIESLSNDCYPWNASSDSKITMIQELDLVFMMI